MLLHESDDAYFANPAINRSRLWKLLRRTPAHFRFADEEETKAQSIGKAAHVAILQPEILENRVLVGPDVNKNTKEWREYKESAAVTGRALVDPKEWDIIRRMRDNAMQHALVRRLVDGAVIETSVYFDVDGVALKARPDAWNKKLGLMADIKTAANAGARDFSQSVARYGYHLQEYMYAKGLVLNQQHIEGTVFIVIEKESPYLVALYELDPHAISEAKKLFDKALADYKACAKNESWPGYTPEGPETINLPAWAFSRDDYDPYEAE